MVRAGGRHLEGAPAEGLAAHVGQVEYRPRIVLGRCRRRRRPCRLTPEHPGQLGQRRHPVGLLAAHERRLAHVAEGHDEAGRRRGVGQGDHARDVTERPVEAELATECQPLGAGRADLARGDEQADGDGKVQPGAALSHPDGARLTVTRRRGHDSPLERTAARTRSRASRTAASGRPTMVNPGSPFDTWTSTETGRPRAPLSVADATSASMRENGRAHGGLYRSLRRARHLETDDNFVDQRLDRGRVVHVRPDEQTN